MKVLRKVGQGDLEHVRERLLSVGIVSQNGLHAQFLGALSASYRLKLRFRAYVVGDASVEAELIPLMQRHQAAEAQLIVVKEMTERTHALLDMVLQPDENENVSADDVERDIIQTWNKYGGRFANGNFGRLDAQTLTDRYLTNADSI